MKLHYAIHKDDQKLFFVFFLLWLAVLIVTSIFYLYGPPFVPLWYTRNVAIEQLADKVFIWVFSALATIVFVLSLFFGRSTNLEHERYVARVSLWTGLALIVFLLIAELRIVKLLL